MTSPNGDPNTAIAAYVDREAWQIQQIEEAIEQADRPDADWILTIVWLSVVVRVFLHPQRSPSTTSATSFC
jgi:hypothetical protein